MTRTDVLAAFKSAASEVLAIDEERVIESASLMNDFDADSLDVVEVVMMVEERLDLKIPDSLWEDVNNIGEAITRILMLDGADQ